MFYILQYLEFVALFPEMYKDVKCCLLKTRDSLRIGKIQNFSHPMEI